MDSPNSAAPSSRNGKRSAADEKKLFIRQADVFAAYVAYTDNEIGRVIQEVKDLGKLDNTLIIYIAATMARARKAPPSARRSTWLQFKPSIFRSRTS